MSDTEIVSDDDVAVVVEQIIDLDKIENAKGHKRKSKQIETIVIDDETHSQTDNNNVINSKNDYTLDINSLYKENKLLAEFIEKCLNLEHAGAMLRIINRTLLRVYNESDKGYKNSPEFEKILQKQINLIETEPHRKYSHMKNIIEALKSGGIKKRVQLTTLATNLKNKQNKRFADFGDIGERLLVKRSKKDEIIDLDSEPNDVIPVINLDEDPNDVIVLDEPSKTRIDEEKENMQISAVNNPCEFPQLLQSETINHEDVNKTDNKATQKNSKENSYLKPQKEMFVPNNITKQQSVITEPVQRHAYDVIESDEPARTRIDDEKENIQINEFDDNHRDNAYEYRNSQNDSEEISYLTPQIEMFPNNLTEQQSMVTEPINRHMDHNIQIGGPIYVENSTEEEEHKSIQEEIKKIESQIEKCKLIIQQLDEAEVTKDNFSSPYVISEKVKQKIVSLYKTLCELTGSESIKKRTVRLQVQEGHPAGPVRRLEEFINSNIGEDGNPQFPDFRDVIMCVLQANEADGLGWSKGQILKEANALFTQCGRALQKRRQKREWRDLLAAVKTETLEYDPADEDPVLQAKLEQNRRIALCKEHELLDRFSRLQDMSTQAKLNKMNPHPATQNGIVIDSPENIIQQNEDNIIIEVPAVNKNGVNITTNEEHETIDSSDVSNTTTQNSLVIIKTEVSVEFETPENVEIADESKESVRLYLKDTNYVPCSERLQMEEDNPIEKNDTSKPNVEIKTEIGMNVHSRQNENCSDCLDKENNSSCEVAASNKNNIKNVDSDSTINSNSTKNSQDDISKNQHATDSKNGAGDSLVNEQTNSLDTVKIKKEPVDIVALLDGLGDNFSADIVDIEDPFLVIEISDSSDEEE